MSECFQDYFICNGEIKPKVEFLLPDQQFTCIYEVLRIEKNVPLFLKLHTERFLSSLKIIDLQLLNAHEIFTNTVKQLIDINSSSFGNVRFALFVKNIGIDYFAYFIEHFYPSVSMYKYGVKLKSLQIVRPNPNAKIFHVSIKEKINNILQDKSLYEVVLVDDVGKITEGSRSNLFFIKGNSVYTAPDNFVLQGITRNIVSNIISKLGYTLILEQIAEKDLAYFEAAFLTGTSPKVLGINCINNVPFDMNNEILKKIAESYNYEIEFYLKSNM